MLKPDIAFFLPLLAGGGAERVCLNLAAGFLDRGFRVDLVLAKAAGPLMKDIPEGTRVVVLGAARTVMALPKLTAYLRREKPAVLVAAPDHANLIAIWAGMLASSRTDIIATNHINITFSTRQTPKLQEKLYPWLLRLFHSGAKYIVSVSEGNADALLNMTGIPRRKVHVIHNPVVSPDLLAASREPLDHPWFVPGSPPVLLAVGRLEPQKDYPTLLDAFVLLRDTRPARLVIIGEGSQRAALQEKAASLGIAGDVELRGYDPNPYRFMAQADVFVLSSAWEGFGNVLVEAMACGTPVVSTDCPSGPAEILAGGEYGRLVRPADPGALAEAITQTLDAPLDGNLLRARANEFTLDTISKQYLSLFFPEGHSV